jgi:hypothetical protein
MLLAAACGSIAAPVLVADAFAILSGEVSDQRFVITVGGSACPGARGCPAIVDRTAEASPSPETWAGLPTSKFGVSLWPKETITSSDPQRELVAMLMDSGLFSRDALSADSQFVFPMRSAALNLIMGGLVLADVRAPVARPMESAGNPLQLNPGDLASPGTPAASAVNLREMINSLIETSPVNVQLSTTREASSSAYFSDPTVDDVQRMDSVAQRRNPAQAPRENWAVNTVRSVLTAFTDLARAIKNFFRGGSSDSA